MSRKGICGFARSPALADFEFRSLREFSRPMALRQVWDIASAFLVAITVVVFPRSQKQMIRPNTRRIITAVEHARAGRNCAVVNLPRNAVRKMVNRLLMFSLTNRAIAATFDCSSSPDPARAKLKAQGWPVLINALPESVSEWYFRFSHDVNLQHRFANWLEPFAVLTHLGGSPILTWKPFPEALNLSQLLNSGPRVAQPRWRIG